MGDNKKNGSRNNIFESLLSDYPVGGSKTSLKKSKDKDLRPANLTEEESERDKSLTNLFSEYVEAYKIKTSQNRKFKWIILLSCLCVIIAFTAVLLFLISITFLNNDFTYPLVISLVSVSVSYVGMFLGVLKIITSYVFPKNEEQYITKIVELIQHNDLEHKKEDLKANLKK